MQDQMYVSGMSMVFQSEIWIPGKAWCHGAPAPEFSTVVTATDSTDRTAEVDWCKINRFNPGTSVRYDASPFKSQLPLLTLNINNDPITKGRTPTTPFCLLICTILFIRCTKYCKFCKYCFYLTTSSSSSILTLIISINWQFVETHLSIFTSPSHLFSGMIN